MRSVNDWVPSIHMCYKNQNLHLFRSSNLSALNILICSCNWTRRRRVWLEAGAVPDRHDGHQRADRRDGAELLQGAGPDRRQRADADDVHHAAHPVPPADVSHRRRPVAENVSYAPFTHPSAPLRYGAYHKAMFFISFIRLSSTGVTPLTGGQRLKPFVE